MHSISADMVHNEEDMRVIAQRRLEQVAECDPSFTVPPSTQSNFQTFVEKAGGLPLWIVVVTNHLKETLDPMEQFQTVLSLPSGHHHQEALHRIYDHIVQKCVERLGVADRQRFSRAVDILLALGESVRTSTLLEIARHNPEIGELKLQRCIDLLKPLLLGTGKNPVIEFVHLSIREYLASDASWLRKNYSDGKLLASSGQHAAHRMLFRACQSHLTDWCTSSSSDELKAVQSQERERIAVTKPFLLDATVLYTSSYWVQHLSSMENTNAEDTASVISFLQEHFDVWAMLLRHTTKFRTLLDLKEYILVRQNSSGP